MPPDPVAAPRPVTAGTIVRWAAWATLAFLAAVMLTRWVGLTSPRVLVLQALTPLWTVVSAVLAAVLIVRRERTASFLALALLSGHVAAVLPAVWPHGTPDWVEDAATEQVTVFVANLYYFNEHPDAVEPLLATDAEILVLLEVTEAWPDRIEDAGIFERYPYHLTHRKGRAAESIVLSKLPITDARWGPGPVAIPIATIDVRGVPLAVIGVHPPAPIDPSGAQKWKGTLQRVEALARRRPTDAAIFAGDFNATRWHAPFHDLLEAGLSDAHERTGAGLTRSWPVGRRIPPFMRLDHALLTDNAAALDTRQITVPGSDHRAFEVDLALRVS